MRVLFNLWMVLGGTAALLAGCTPATNSGQSEPGQGELRVNHIQVVGTHNSYHVRPQEPLFSAIKAARPGAAASWDYTHAPLNVQMDRGVRSFELDVYYQPEGYRVMHVPDYDFESTCSTFIEGLTVMQSWSDAHPSHVPILVLVETKDDPIKEVTSTIRGIGTQELDALDRELLSVFPPERLIRPDDVRGDFLTLKQAVLEKGWPTLESVRGKFLFALHADLPTLDIYTEGRPSLEGRAMFTTTIEERPDAAVLVMNDPFHDDIGRLVRAGYIVRTRADADLQEAKANDVKRREAAFASGAHVVSTDFPAGEAHTETGYVVQIPEGGSARCNPIAAPQGCDAKQLENYK